jgi:dTDP-4-dehydrorhamnose reductase
MDLLIGGNSEIGSCTADHLARAGRAVVRTTRRIEDVGPDRTFLDFDQDLAGWEPPPGTATACIFVAIARLAACHADPAGSEHVNCTQTIALIDRLIARDIFTLFLSTNQVFNGETAHVEAEAETNPVSAYGRQKAKTEAAIRTRMARGAPVAILRLAKVASPGMPLIAGWRRELGAGRPIRAFADMTMAPTPTALVADAIAALLAAREPVIAQLTGPRDMTYADVGRLVANEVGADPALVANVSALENGLPPGATPRHTTLDSSYLRRRFDIVAPDVADVVRAL